jgi:glycosyltransferase involved in cell wall biosynthesis
VSRVLLLIKGLGAGGAERLLVSSARLGDGSKFTYEVAYLLPHKDALVKELDGAGIAVHCLRGAKGASWLPRLRRLVADRRIDLVHVHSPYPATGARITLPARVPIVYTEHNLWARYHRATYWGNLLTYPRNAHVFAVADDVRRSIRYPRALARRRMPKVETLYHGPDPDSIAQAAGSDGVRAEFGIPEGAPIVGTIANFKVHKGYPFLFDAAAKVRTAMPDVRFMCIGVGAEEEESRRDAHAKGLDRTVIFTGFRSDAIRLAAAFDVFALASLHEGLPIALVEAMALGKPSVATRVGGVPEVVEDGRQGFLVAPADPDALAGRIVQLLSDAPLRSRMGAEARTRSAHFDLRRAVRRIEHVYAEVLA